ncbi:diguanylate cyclase [Frateuria aurantia]
MPLYANAEEHRARELRFVDRVCQMRGVGTIACGIVIGSTLLAHGNPYGGVVWCVLALNALLWPVCAWQLARRSAAPLTTERRQLVLDGLFAGCWIAAVGISPVPTAVIVCALMAGRVSSDEWRSFAGAMLVLAMALGMGWWLLGRPWWPELSVAAMAVSMLCLLVYIFTLSYMLRTQLRALQLRNEALQRQNRTDPSIELPNRRYFEVRLAEAYSRYRHYRQTASLLLIDIDHFKEINDSRGHHAGDQILTAVADILRGTVRAGDLPARYGGDEFAVLLINANRVAAEHAAQRIVGMLSRRTLHDGSSLGCTLSIGVAELAMDHTGLQAWVNAADAALYRAKAAGRNRIMVA